MKVTLFRLRVYAAFRVFLNLPIIVRLEYYRLYNALLQAYINNLTHKMVRRKEGV